MTRALATALALAAAAIAAPLAIAQDGGAYQSAAITFGADTARTPTFEDIAIDYRSPDDPEGKPQAVRRVETILQGGARYDDTAVPPCTASDAELIAQGEAACPAASKIGEGSTTVDTGVPGEGRFLEVDIDFFNNDRELVYLNTDRGSGARVVVRGRAYKRRVVTDLDMLPGTPPDGGAIDTVQIRIGTLAGAPDAEPSGYLTTPKRCPKRRSWINRIRFTYANGAERATVNEIPCAKRRRR